MIMQKENIVKMKKLVATALLTNDFVDDCEVLSKKSKAGESEFVAYV